MNAGFSTLMVYVNDMARSTTFYRAVLDAAPQMESPYWTQFELGSGVMLALHPARDGQTRPAPGWTPGFSVADLHAARAKLLAAGGTVAMDYHDVPGGVILEIADPDGNVLDLSQMGITAAELAK